MSGLKDVQLIKKANLHKNWNMQTLILESFEYFCQMSSKSILIISSYTVSKLVRFFLRHSVHFEFVYYLNWRN